MKDKRFPFTLTGENAKRIIKISCNEWEEALIKKWATDILLRDKVEVTEDFYKIMRGACVKEQNLLFDEIFGEDKEAVFILDDGVPLYVGDTYYAMQLEKGYGNPNILKAIKIKLEDRDGNCTHKRLKDSYFKLNNPVEGILRYSTEEALLDAYQKYLNEPKDGQLVYVRDSLVDIWLMRFYSKNKKCYYNQELGGRTISWSIISITNPLEEDENLI